MKDFDLQFTFDRSIDSLRIFIRRDREERAGKADVAETNGSGLRDKAVGPRD